MTSQHQPMQTPLTGILFAMLGLFLFAGMDTTTKYLSAHYNIPFIVAMRYLVHFLLMILLLVPRHSHVLLKTNRRGLVILRGLMLTLASLFIGLALTRMPLAETTAIYFFTPILVALLAIPILGEKISGWGWLAIMGGFIGVLIIIRPGSGLGGLGIVFALLTAVVSAAYQLLSRMLANTEKTVTLLFYTALIGSLCFGLALPWFWESRTPTQLEFCLLIGIGAAGGLGHYFFTLAFRHATASLIAPVTYVQLIWAGLLGWIVFDHTPDALGIMGMCIVAASGLMIALKSHFTKTR